MPTTSSCCAVDRLANPVAGSANRRRTILPLLEERAGVRTDVKPFPAIPNAADVDKTCEELAAKILTNTRLL